MFTIGSDPEVFAKRGGKIIPAVGLVPGNKDNPHPVDDGAVQVDGLALEFNIHPTDRAEVFKNRLASVRQQLEVMADVEISDDTTADFDPEDLHDVPFENLELGCDPDYNAWSEEFNEPPSVEGRENFRTAGGHIHFGMGIHIENTNDPGIYREFCPIVKMFDYHIGLPSLIWDKDVKRRKLYGKAGAFRLKPYGLEYRSLSNKWIFDPRLVDFVFEETKKIYDRLVKADYDVDRVLSESEKSDAVYDTINLSNVDYAKHLNPDGCRRVKEILGG